MKNILANWVMIIAVLAVTPHFTIAVGDKELHPDIAYALNAVPDGVALDSFHARWSDGMEVLVPDPAARSVVNCPTARICAFSGSATNGTTVVASALAGAWKNVASAVTDVQCFQ